MLNYKDLSRKYVKLYTYLRDFLWDIDTVEALAELEVAVYNRFPDIDSIQRKLNYLVSLVKSTNIEDEDEEFSQLVSDFCETLNSCDEIYSDLPSVKEVTVNEDNSEDISTEENPREHRISARIHRKREPRF